MTFPEWFENYTVTTEYPVTLMNRVELTFASLFGMVMGLFGAYMIAIGGIGTFSRDVSILIGLFAMFLGIALEVTVIGRRMCNEIKSDILALKRGKE